jgi:hypothetical protein
VRWLTRTESENTINDLLAIKVAVRDLFPDDGVTAGFDKVGTGLTLSAAHFEAYQAAADKALAEAIPQIPFAPTLWHRDSVIPNHKKGEVWDKSALVISRFEVEGPLKADGTLETWPPESYRVFFDDLPLERLSKVSGEKPARGTHDPWVPVSKDARADAARSRTRSLRNT